MDYITHRSFQWFVINYWSSHLEIFYKHLYSSIEFDLIICKSHLITYNYTKMLKFIVKQIDGPYKDLEK